VFKSGDLYIAFGPAPIRQETYPLATVGEAVPNHAAQNAEALERDEDEIKAERLRMLMIENPMEYERQLRDGELDDANESDESESDS